MTDGEGGGPVMTNYDRWGGGAKNFPLIHDDVICVRSLNANLKMSGPREDGIPLGIVKSRYRTQISNALCFGILRGKALALNCQGRAEAFRS